MKTMMPRYLVKETLNNLRQSKTRHLFSLTIICLSFLIVGVFLSLANNLGEKAVQLSRNLNVVFYLRKEATPAERDLVEKVVRASPLSGSVLTLSSEEARERFLKDYPDLSDIVKNLGDNPFPASVEMTLRRPDLPAEEVLRLIEEVRRNPAVDDARFDRDWAERLRAMGRLVRNAGFFLGGILILASFLIVSNVIKLNVLARRSEIELLRLVGATNAFIRGPFLLEGTIMGVFGGILSLVLVYAVARLFPVTLGGSIGALGELVAFRFLTFFQAASLVGGGALVGFLGSLSSVARFLRV